MKPPYRKSVFVKNTFQVVISDHNGKQTVSSVLLSGKQARDCIKRSGAKHPSSVSNQTGVEPFFEVSGNFVVSELGEQKHHQNDCAINGKNFCQSVNHSQSPFDDHCPFNLSDQEYQDWLAAKRADQEFAGTADCLASLNGGRASCKAPNLPVD